MKGAASMPRPFSFMRILTLLAIPLAVTACTGDDDDDLAQPSPAKIVVTGPVDVTEEVPATYTVQVVTTSGEPTSWSGFVDVAALTGPVTPTQVAVSNGQGVQAFTLEYSSSGVSLGLEFTAPGLEGFTRFLNIATRVPVPVDGAAALASVFDRSTTGWDRDGVWSPSVWDAGTELRMLYASSTTGGAPQIGLARSSDGGMTWTRGAAPVIGPLAVASACATDGAQHPGVFRRADGTLGALYQGRVGTRLHLCLAESVDGGSTWTPVDGAAEDGAVLATSSTPFEQTELRSASVVLTTGQRLEAIYAAQGVDDIDALNPGPETIVGVGLAHSTNGGLSWTKIPGPFSGAIISVYHEAPNGLTWDAYEITDPGIHKDGPVYRSYLGGLANGGYRIGLYEALDLSYLPGHVDNLAVPFHEMIGLGVAGRFDENGSRFPSVIDVAGVRTVFYTGIAADGTRRIGLARCE